MPYDQIRGTPFSHWAFPQLQAPSSLKAPTQFAQSQQSLTCPIYLALLYEPYALAPYGHLASFNCLVSCFTTVPLVIIPNPLPVPRRSKRVRVVV
ncbi:hypothetical protein JAAARDRAFT_543446 [Jaapia argillacea MUCL 33604]|uniref:Uncharacterized protein n=1 Tax=Jaapia argillacea MUCL 33604 TaxID=933084 RepID=A0A067PIZ0_9AGAM|nr:hypothetical protein JAAARDRAFT_543446 [Jaapia argillacea MUCL 33604]